MSLNKILLGIVIVILSALLARFGELDDSPGAVLIALILGIFGIYLIIRSIKPKKTAKAGRRIKHNLKVSS